jgi:hypothetical protein
MADVPLDTQERLELCDLQELHAGASVLSRLEGIAASGPAASRIRQPAFHGISAYQL